ncbi:hypothetical protein TNCV_4253321 [Trichonephila clavipes]|nr:hypothetical protein TNCV_4253321 [Trichonephila clavipes]
MAATAWVIVSFSAHMVVELYSCTCIFKCPHRKNHQVTYLGGQVMSHHKERRRPGNNCPRMSSKRREMCELWLRLIETRFLLLHDPQEIGLTLVSGRSESRDSSNLK